MATLRDDLDRWLHGLVEEPWRLLRSADVRETDDAVVVTANVPGLDRDDLELELPLDGAAAVGRRRRAGRGRGAQRRAHGALPEGDGVLHRLERERASRVIALVHRQETMSLFGFPLMRHIDVNDSEDVLRAIKLIDPDWPIDMIVHTPGGLVLAAGQIAHALKRHRAKMTVFVPHYAMSGGTLIARAAGEIVMDPNAVLGPVDPQIGQSSARSPRTSRTRR